MNEEKEEIVNEANVSEVAEPVVKKSGSKSKKPKGICFLVNDKGGHLAKLIDQRAASEGRTRSGMVRAILMRYFGMIQV